MEITISTIPVSELKNKKEYETTLEFGKYFTDRMFQINFSNGKWVNPRITKYGPLLLEPSAIALQYGQAIFEGMKSTLPFKYGTVIQEQIIQ